MTRHLLVTNDFPPKIGGIQSYLWELWRRLPADSFAVYCTPHRGAADFDRAQPFRVIRSPEPVLLPYPWLARRIDELADELGASLVMLDPAVPLGAIGPRLRHPYGVVLHGAEVTVPARLPALRQVLGRVLRGARLVVAAGSYAADEATRAAGVSLPVVVVPPGVDVDRFRPLSAGEIDRARLEHALPTGRPLVLAVSRLVPRKGFDTMLRAASRARPAVPDLVVAIAGAGRDRARLERMAAELDVPAVFLGRVPDEALPSLYGCADVFAMLCRVRWGGLEQEGFGIVFVEAAAAGVAQVAGASGGAAEAVETGVSGFVIDPPTDVQQVTTALVELLQDATLRDRMGAAARARAVREFRYDVLTERLSAALDAAV
ncbi:MAG TPA: glycosyltransferase family 4 protein [Acidimicrobiales bacterium]|nr:glycosyltransferase family 4 protein [Acidimicrobiales bacterium]